MATDFGLDNQVSVGRFMEFPLRPEWAITSSGTPWSLVSALQVVDATGQTLFGYFHSTNTWGDPNSVNLYHGEDGTGSANDWIFRISSLNGQQVSAPDGPLGNGVWTLYCVSWNLANWRIRVVRFDANNVVENTQPGGYGGSSDPVRILFGCRFDTGTERYYKNRLAWHGQWNFDLLDQDLIDLANGVLTPFEMRPGNLRVLADFTDHNNVTELLSGDTLLLKNGTGYANVPQPYPTQPAVPVGYETHTIV